MRTIKYELNLKFDCWDIYGSFSGRSLLFLWGGGGLRGRAFCGQFWFFGVVTMSCACGSGRGGEGDGFPMKYTNIQISNTHYDNFKKMFSGRQYQLISLC